jgi:hypothetical protein
MTHLPPGPTGERRSFPIAPMAPVFIGLTALVLLIAPAFVLFGVLAGAPAGNTLVLAGSSVALLSVGVWLWSRPSRFDVFPLGITIVWPLRHRTLLRGSVSEVRLVPRTALREELGFAVRVGVGGLFGTFGLLWTSRKGWTSVYITRADGFVLLVTRAGRPLLITPADPEEFVRTWNEGARD